MKGLLFTISLLLSFSCLSQTIEKSVYYLDVDGNYISKEKFIKKKTYKKDSPRYLNLYFENDSSYLSILHPRKKYDKLFPREKEILYAYLDSLNKKSIDRLKFIVIQWYPGKDPCNSSGTTYSGKYRYRKNYLRKLRKHFNHEMLWMYKDDDNLVKRPKLNWQHDDKKIVENLFFKYHFPCGSFVVIAPNGNYISLYAEYNGNKVLEICEEMKKSNPQ